jgi:hypothetical protein
LSSDFIRREGRKCDGCVLVFVLAIGFCFTWLRRKVHRGGAFRCDPHHDVVLCGEQSPDKRTEFIIDCLGGRRIGRVVLGDKLAESCYVGAYEVEKLSVADRRGRTDDRGTYRDRPRRRVLEGCELLDRPWSNPCLDSPRRDGVRDVRISLS